MNSANGGRAASGHVDRPQEAYAMHPTAAPQRVRRDPSHDAGESIPVRYKWSPMQDQDQHPHSLTHKFRATLLPQGYNSGPHTADTPDGQQEQHDQQTHTEAAGSAAMQTIAQQQQMQRPQLEHDAVGQSSPVKIRSI
ncbi:hypothetical protein WOLCODRAFT_155488 [Wolfiporia cocos MD-104 SS10]|uniref:Uncharacterized protein n=1 Tax=Wolfiporia cocos (strain MD-104) TaxID=742152 RepID=A0A2H3IZG8_WOLCO|nr:hypothetical protein WOLCODRAFT_155488 [Wolfiporia cocos MD-104 SS10]